LKHVFRKKQVANASLRHSKGIHMRTNFWFKFSVSLTRGLVLAKLLKTAAYGLQHWSIIQNV